MKGFYITIKNGLLDPKHVAGVSEAVWLFLWLIDKMTIINHETGVGKVLGGRPVTFEADIEPVLGVSSRTYNRWVKILKDGGYINVVRTPYGLVFEVFNSSKIFKQKPEEKERYAKNVVSQEGAILEPQQSELFDEEEGGEPVAEIRHKVHRDTPQMVKRYATNAVSNKTMTKTMQYNTLPDAPASSNDKVLTATEKKPTPHKQFIIFWHGVVKKTRGIDGTITKRDAANLKRVLFNGVDRQTLEQAALYFLADHQYKTFTPSIATFTSHGILTGILNKVKNDPKFWRTITEYEDRYLSDVRRMLPDERRNESEGNIHKMDNLLTTLLSTLYGTSMRV
jgi:hypothetical protein